MPKRDDAGAGAPPPASDNQVSRMLSAIDPVAGSLLVGMCTTAAAAIIALHRRLQRSTEQLRQARAELNAAKDVLRDLGAPADDVARPRQGIWRLSLRIRDLNNYVAALEAVRSRLLGQVHFSQQKPGERRTLRLLNMRIDSAVPADDAKDMLSCIAETLEDLFRVGLVSPSCSPSHRAAPDSFHVFHAHCRPTVVPFIVYLEPVAAQHTFTVLLNCYLALG